jgi:hypothetical protein
MGKFWFRFSPVNGRISGGIDYDRRLIGLYVITNALWRRQVEFRLINKPGFVTI